MLRRISGPQLAEYYVACPPSLRRMVVAVRADNGPNLPVLNLGKELARTDANGAATIVMQSHPNESFDLTLGTTEKGNERIRPQNPSASFTMRSVDDIVTFDQKFTWQAKAAVYHAAPPKPIQIKPRQVGFTGG
jgi:hypothetical protein